MEQKTLTYNALDSAITFEIFQAFWHDLEEQGYNDTYKLTTDIIPPLTFMMHRGICVNRDALEQARRDVERKIEEKQQELNEAAGRYLNPLSSKDCQAYFYIELGIKPFTKTNAKGQQTITCDDKAMQRLAVGTANRPPIPAAKLVQELRALHKLKGTYLDIEFDRDGRFRCSVNPRGTVTGRISTSKTIYGTGMNMQNLPLEFKRFLIADPGFVMIEVDKAGAEWVVVAYLSGDPNMIRIVEEGLDPHAATANLMFNVPIELIQEENKLIGHETDPGRIAKLREKLPGLEVARFLPRNMSLRQAGKKSNHGLNYGEGPRMFALQNEIPEFEAKRLVDLYHAAYPNIRNVWHRRIQNEMRSGRVLINFFGRKRRFLDKLGDQLFKAAYAHEPQSTVSDNLNVGMVHIYNDRSPEMLDLELLAQVHDSLLSQYPLADIGRLAACIAKQCKHMNIPITIRGRTFTIKTDVKVGLNWHDMHELPRTTNVGELKRALQKLPEIAR